MCTVTLIDNSHDPDDDGPIYSIIIFFTKLVLVFTCDKLILYHTRRCGDYIIIIRTECLFGILLVVCVYYIGFGISRYLVERRKTISSTKRKSSPLTHSLFTITLSLFPTLPLSPLSHIHIRVHSFVSVCPVGHPPQVVVHSYPLLTPRPLLIEYDGRRACRQHTWL